MSFRGEKSLCGVFFFETTSCYVSTGKVLWSCLEPYIKYTITQTCVVSCSASSSSYRFLLLQSLSALLHSIPVSLSSISTTTYQSGGDDDATHTNSGVSVCFRAARSTTKGWGILKRRGKQQVMSAFSSSEQKALCVCLTSVWILKTVPCLWGGQKQRDVKCVLGCLILSALWGCVMSRGRWSTQDAVFKGFKNRKQERKRLVLLPSEPVGNSSRLPIGPRGNSRRRSLLHGGGNVSLCVTLGTSSYVCRHHVIRAPDVCQCLTIKFQSRVRITDST